MHACKVRMATHTLYMLGMMLDFGTELCIVITLKEGHYGGGV